jgi:hypothetical protein
MKAKADAIMGAMEMYATIKGWRKEHIEFMLNPTQTTREAIGQRINRCHTPAAEDDRVRWVYQYYVYFCDTGMERDFVDLVEAYKRLEDYRFPRMSHSEAAKAFEMRRKLRKTPPRVIGDIATVLRHRTWHRRQSETHNIHRAIYQAWEYVAPANAVQLVMEWPHASKQGDHMIAYTRDEKYGEADRVMTTSVSKYLARHFPALASNIVRDIAARYVEAQIGIVRTMREMLEIIENGPKSCMAGKAIDEFSTNGVHPYEAYDPQYGWHMAYVKEGGAITGRAMLNDDVWVRTYRTDGSNSGYSQSDDRLNVWLKDQGYHKGNDWEGFKLARIRARNNCGFVAPYLDGGTKDVDDHGTYLRVVGCGDGDYVCESTNGDATERDALQCDDCDNRMNEDDSYHVYVDGSSCVCQYCYERRYTTVIGRRGDSYAIRDHDAIAVDGEWYDPEYLSDNDIVELHNGEYCRLDSAVCISSNGEWYAIDSDDICYTKAGEHELREDCVELADGEWCLECDAWMCEHSGDWYACADADSVTTKGGKIIHENYAHEYDLLETAK